MYSNDTFMKTKKQNKKYDFYEYEDRKDNSKKDKKFDRKEARDRKRNYE